MPVAAFRELPHLTYDTIPGPFSNKGYIYLPCHREPQFLVLLHVLLLLKYSCNSSNVGSLISTREFIKGYFFNNLHDLLRYREP